MVIKEALKQASVKLCALEYTDPDREAMMILEKLLDKDISYIYLNLDKELDLDVELRFLEIVKKRSKNYPFHYIFKEKEFYDLSLYVEEGVLIPRGETEILVDYLIDYINKRNIEMNVVEVGSGSGAIGITLAKHCKKIDIIGLDICDKAIEIGNINKNRHDLLNINFKKSDIFSNLSENYMGNTDIIVSNPPYIETKDLENLQKDVRLYEPNKALDGGEDGLEFYRDITRESKKYLKKNGLLIYEIGYNQASLVKDILISGNFEDIEIIKDLQGHDRVVLGRSK